MSVRLDPNPASREKVVVRKSGCPTQELVERLVHTHANLKLEQFLELYEAGMLPWDIEMTVEEPLSDDEDGVPHDVSDSESESENDSD